MSLEKDIDTIKTSFDDLLKVQTTDPSVTKEHNPYMTGLANGLLIGKAIVDGSEPEFLTPAKESMSEKKQFIGTCVSNPFRSTNKLQDVIDSADEITKDEFLDECDVDERTMVDMDEYPNDFEYCRSGDVYFFTHSATEHFFK